MSMIQIWHRQGGFHIRALRLCFIQFTNTSFFLQYVWQLSHVFSLRPCPLSSSLCEEEPFPKPMLSIQYLEILYNSRWALLEFQKKDMDKQYFHRISVDEDSNCEVVDSPKASNSRARRAIDNVSLKRSIFWQPFWPIWRKSFLDIL